MDEKTKDINLELSPEEQKAEEEALVEVADDKLREEIAEEMGIDPDTEPDLLDKIVQREKKSRTMLSGAIKQKRNWRDRAENKFKDSSDKTDGGESTKTGDPKDIDAIVNARFEARDLKDLALPEEIENEVKDLAKVKGISIKEAAQLPYIAAMRKDFEEDTRMKNATPTRTKRGSYSSSFDSSKMPDPKDFPFNSPEDIERWNQAKKAHYEYKKQNG